MGSMFLSSTTDETGVPTGVSKAEGLDRKRYLSKMLFAMLSIGVEVKLKIAQTLEE